MRIEFSREADQAYLYLKREIADGEAVTQVVVDDDDLKGELVIDLDADGRVIGLEFPQGARSMLPGELLDGAP